MTRHIIIILATVAITIATSITTRITITITIAEGHIGSDIVCCPRPEEVASTTALLAFLPGLASAVRRDERPGVLHAPRRSELIREERELAVVQKDQLQVSCVRDCQRT